ncbi:MAG: NAD(P)/FAD-dependent oxidoreductase, partial [Pseudonocardiaceae bacterium]
MPIASARPKVLIVGGGISGSAVAYELAQRGATSIVAEREPTLASHASGRSAAQWGPDEGGPVAIAAGPIFDRWSRELRSPGFFTPRPTLFVDTDEVDEIDKLLTRYARGRSMILTPHERRWTGAAPEVLEVSPEAAVHLFPLLDSRKIRRAALDRRDMDIDSHRIVRVLAKGVRQLGGQIRVNAPVTDVVKRGSSWLVQAGDDTVTCDMVVNAAGAWADQISELAGVSIQGVRPLRRSTFLARLPHLMRPHRQTPLLVWGKSGAYVRWAPEADLYGSPADVEPSPPGDPRPNDDAIEQALRSLAAITRL